MEFVRHHLFPFALIALLFCWQFMFSVSATTVATSAATATFPVDDLVRQLLDHYNKRQFSAIDPLVAPDASILIAPSMSCGLISKAEFLAALKDPKLGARFAHPSLEFVSGRTAVFRLSIAGLPGGPLPNGNTNVGYAATGVVVFATANHNGTALVEWKEFLPTPMAQEQKNASAMVSVWSKMARACEDANATALGEEMTSDGKYRYFGYADKDASNDPIVLNKTGHLAGLGPTFAAQTHDRIYVTDTLVACNIVITFFSELMAYNGTRNESSSLGSIGGPSSWPSTRLRAISVTREDSSAADVESVEAYQFPKQAVFREVSFLELDPNYKAITWTVFADSYPGLY